MDRDAGGVDDSECGETRFYLYFLKIRKQTTDMHRGSWIIRSYVYFPSKVNIFLLLSFHKLTQNVLCLQRSDA